ncbi:hypothetical protein DV736_g3619, partial [Chaetothyriales sp. CBS 134916]
MVNDDRRVVCSYLAASFLQPLGECEQVYDSAPRNVRTTLVRQVQNAHRPHPDRPVSSFVNERPFMRALGRLPLEYSIVTLARLYEEVHVYLCRALDCARKGKAHNVDFLKSRCVELKALTDGLIERESAFKDQIYLESNAWRPGALQASWRPIPSITFDNLPVLNSLADLLPGEMSIRHEYAGIGGGGGSDVISTSIMGHLLRLHKKEMDLLISTRTWAIGSQGKAGAKMGIKREVYKHGGTVNYANGTPVPGTYRVEKHTHAEGRDLEAIPYAKHSQIYMVLDQGESRSSIPEGDQANLPDQFQAILSQSKQPIQTIMTIDTGGDVFGVDIDCGTTATPDQDYRVQQAISTLSGYDLVTCVVAPGVDAPSFSPEIAEQAGGMVYHLSRNEKDRMLKLLVDEYRMDGSDPNRFGKTSLALQARLKGKLGWVSLDLPEYVVDTWENPWNSFVYVRECMEDLVLMPTVKLVRELDRRRGKELITTAAGGGHIEIVDRLIAANAEVNAPAASHGHTALQAAAGGGHLKIVERLIAANAEVNTPAASHGHTALQAAAGGGHLKIVERLIAANAEVNAPAASHGHTALQAAAGGGHPKIVEILIAAGAEVNAPAASHGHTALQAAAGGGHPKIVEILIAAGAEVNAPAASHGHTALQAAAGGGHPKIVEILIAAGAGPESALEVPHVLPSLDPKENIAITSDKKRNKRGYHRSAGSCGEIPFSPTRPGGC